MKGKNTMSNIIRHEKEIKVWVGFNVPVEEILEHNKNAATIEELFSIDKAEENGLDVWEYYDDCCLEGVSFYHCDHTGETYQDDDMIADIDFTELMASEAVMGNKELMAQIIKLVAQNNK